MPLATPCKAASLTRTTEPPALGLAEAGAATPPIKNPWSQFAFGQYLIMDDPRVNYRNMPPNPDAQPDILRSSQVVQEHLELPGPHKENPQLTT